MSNNNGDSNNTTTFERMQEAMASQQPCSCGRGQKPNFYCWDEKCPNFTKQPLYCTICFDEDPPKHDHRGRTIASRGDLLKNDWKALRARISEASKNSKAWFDKHSALVDLMTQEIKI